MSINLYYIGRSKKNFYKDPEKVFQDRICKYTKFKIIEISPDSYPNSMSADQIKSKEEQILKKKLKDNQAYILLDENGQHFNSKQFSEFINKKQVQGAPLNFVIGGAYGFSEGIKQNAQAIVSLSKLTFPHHLARLVFLEQLYRAFTILKNEPYHNS